MINNRLSRGLSLLLTLVLCLCAFPLSTLAVDNTPSIESNTLDVQSIEEAGVSKEKAMQVLDVSKDEAQDMECYLITIPTASDHVSIGSEDTHTFPKFSFSGENGGSYFTVNGNQMKYAVVWWPNSNSAAYLRIHLYKYGYPTYISTMYLTSIGNIGNVQSKQSDWISTTKGLDYRFVYKSCYEDGSATPARCSVQMLVGVV